MARKGKQGCRKAEIIPIERRLVMQSTEGNSYLFACIPLLYKYNI